MSSPYAIASAPDAQALTGVCTPARACRSRPTAAAGPFGMSIGTVCGDTRRGPFSRSTSYWSSRVVTPPMPEATDDARAAPAPRSGLPASRPGLAGSDQRELLRAVERAGLDAVEHVEGSTVDARGDAHREVGRPLLGRARPTPDFPASSAAQRAGDIAADGRGCTEAGDDDLPCVHSNLLCHATQAVTPAFSM